MEHTYLNSNKKNLIESCKATEYELFQKKRPSCPRWAELPHDSTIFNASLLHD